MEQELKAKIAGEKPGKQLDARLEVVYYGMFLGAIGNSNEKEEGKAAQDEEASGEEEKRAPSFKNTWRRKKGEWGLKKIGERRLPKG